MKHTASRLGKLLLLAWVITLPLQTRWIAKQGVLAGGVWEYGTVSVYATDILLLAAALCTIAARRSSWFRLPERMSSTITVTLLAFLGILGVSALVGINVGVSINAWVRFLAALLAYWTLLQSSVSLKGLGLALVISAAGEAVAALATFVVQAVPESTWFGMAAHRPEILGDAVVQTESGRYLRAYGTLPHPNITAGYLGFGAVVAMGIYLRTHETLERAAILLGYLLIIAGLFLTFSRTSILAWAVCVLGMTLGVLLREQKSRFIHLHREKPTGLKMMKILVATMLLFGVFLYVYKPLVASRTTPAGRIEQRAISERLGQYADARELFTNNWLLGVGVGGYTKALFEKVDTSRASWLYQPVHSVYVLAFVELGIVGGLLFVSAIGTVATVLIWEHRRRWRRYQSTTPPWVAIWGLALAFLAIVGLADHYIWTLPFGIMMTFLALGAAQKSAGE